MASAIYDAVAFGMRYWFILIIGIMLLTLILVSNREYRERKAVMGEVGQYIGYLEIIGGADDVLGERIGIMVENMVGNSRNADIMILDPSVARNHAMINRREGRLMLVPLENAMTKINGRRASRAHQIFTGDRVSFGNIEALVYVKGQEEDHDH